MTKTKGNVMERLKHNAKYLAVASSFGVTSATIMPVAADVDDTAGEVVGEILKFVCTIFRYIGIVLLAWGIGQLVLAFKNEDADSKSRAIMLIIVSIVLVALKSALKAILNTVDKDVAAAL